jgi:hypothetical protein
MTASSAKPKEGRRGPSYQGLRFKRSKTLASIARGFLGVSRVRIKIRLFISGFRSEYTRWPHKTSSLSFKVSLGRLLLVILIAIAMKSASTICLANRHVRPVVRPGTFSKQSFEQPSLLSCHRKRIRSRLIELFEQSQKSDIMFDASFCEWHSNLALNKRKVPLLVRSSLEHAAAYVHHTPRSRAWSERNLCAFSHLLNSGSTFSAGPLFLISIRSGPYIISQTP